MATCPVISCSGSLLHTLVVWAATHLQEIFRCQLSYISSSHSFKLDLLSKNDLPPNTVLFTLDATVYYTNIKTTHALREISTYIRQKSTQFLQIDAIMEALRIIMTNSVFNFGDTYWHQLSGTAMGTPPACDYTTIFYTVHEDQFVQQFPNLVYYKSYIYDVFSVCAPICTQEEYTIEWVKP